MGLLATDTAKPFMLVWLGFMFTPAKQLLKILRLCLIHPSLLI